jgi:hypothetical protein
MLDVVLLIPCPQRANMGRVEVQMTAEDCQPVLLCNAAFLLNVLHWKWQANNCTMDPMLAIAMHCCTLRISSWPTCLQEVAPCPRHWPGGSRWPRAWLSCMQRGCHTHG